MPGATTCTVCLVGCVIAKTLGAHGSEMLDPNSFPPSIRDSLRLLDGLRTGQIAACRLTGIELPPGMPRYVPITPFSANDHGRAFIRDMEKLARLFEQHGL